MNGGHTKGPWVVGNRHTKSGVYTETGDLVANTHLAAIVDDMTTSEKSDDLYLEAIVDGIRWGAQAAVNVELAGGAMLRVCLPDGVRITHEWADRYKADQAIKDALAAITSARVTAQKVGDE